MKHLLFLFCFLICVKISAQKENVNTLPIFELKKTKHFPTAVIFSKHASRIAEGVSSYTMGNLKDTAELIFDFGKELVGAISISLKATHPTKAKILYGEDLNELLRDKEFTGGWYVMPKDTFSLKKGSQQISTVGRKAFRYIQIILPPSKATLELADVTATLQHYPVKEGGYFSSSDLQLNKIWEISAHTIKLCMQQYYEDGVKRDGLLWTGDYRVEFLCNILLYGDAALMKKSLFMTAASQNTDGSIPACLGKGGGEQHPENINYMPGMPEGVNNWILINYCLDYISALYEYYFYTGDVETINLLWPSIQKLSPYLLKQDITKLKAGGDFITDLFPYSDSWGGSHGTLALQYYYSFNDLLKLSRIVSDAQTEEVCRSFLKDQKEYISKTYQMENTALFYDVPLSNISSSWHVNAYSVLCEFGEKEDWVDRLHKLKQNKHAAVPLAGFMEHWTLDAKYKAGLAEDALADIRSYWGHMLKYDATSCWDVCDVTAGANNHPDTHAFSRCHGWSASPTYFFPAYILGVKPNSPGFVSVEISPNLGTLPWAEGAIPTPHGIIQVKWQQNEKLEGEILIPKNIKAEVFWKAKKIQLKEGINKVELDY